MTNGTPLQTSVALSTADSLIWGKEAQLIRSASRAGALRAPDEVSQCREGSARPLPTQPEQHPTGKVSPLWQCHGLIKIGVSSVSGSVSGSVTLVGPALQVAEESTKHGIEVYVGPCLGSRAPRTCSARL